MITLLAVLAGITLVADLMLIGLWLTNFKQFNLVSAPYSTVEENHREFLSLPVPELRAYPRVAILLAVRNEEHHLASCLDCLLAQHYPSDKICIWIGNDASTDGTLTIAKSYAVKDARIRVIDIKNSMGEAKAKANVLAHLVQANKHAEDTADFLLITDADTRAPRHWIRGMLQSWQTAPTCENIGIVTGVTLVQNHHVWGHLQRIDWLFALGMVKVVSDLGSPTATMGNNMMVTRQAYEATGGYESLPFSITEDFQILQEITKRGFGFRNAFHQYVATFTLPMPNFGELLQQRKRWMHGAIRLPWPIVILLFLQALFFPFIMMVVVFNFKIAVFIFIGKIFAQSIFIALVVEKIKLRWSVKLYLYAFLLLYDLYAAILSIATIFYYFTPFKTKWKDRTF